MTVETHLALVTGGGKRIGRAIALRLARDGCDVAVHYNTSAEEAAQAVREMEAIGRRAIAVSFDQRDDAQMSEAFAAIRRTLGRAPDVLVNSASIAEIDFFENVDRASLLRHYDINVAGPLLLTQAFANNLASHPGAVVNITDHKLFNPNADHFAYTLSKFALQAANDLLARQLAPLIRVCAVAPGHVLPGPGETMAHFEAVHTDTPLGRGVTPDDIADAVAYIVASPTLTGQTIIVDAGAHLQPRLRDQTLAPPLGRT